MNSAILTKIFKIESKQGCKVCDFFDGTKCIMPQPLKNNFECGDEYNSYMTFKILDATKEIKK